MNALLFLLLLGHPNHVAEDIIASRLTRQSSTLPDLTSLSPLLLQEALLTIGQNGDPAFADKLIPYFNHETAGTTALFAYGEITGADIAPLLSHQPKPDQITTWLEALSKLGGEEEGRTAARALSKLDPNLQNQALFYLWRLNSEPIHQWVLNQAGNEAIQGLNGYPFYLYRAKVPVPYPVAANMAAGLKGDAQGLIYLTRIVPEGQDPQWSALWQSLCRHSDWRVRNQALLALQGVAVKDAEQHALAAISDPNPNVVRTALSILGGSKDKTVQLFLFHNFNSFSQAQKVTLIEALPEDKVSGYMDRIAAWRTSENSFQRANWIHLAGRDPRPEQVKHLKTFVTEGQPGEQTRALNSLATITQLDAAFLQETFENGDFQVKAQIANTVLARDLEFDRTLFEKNELTDFRGPDFQQAFIFSMPDSEQRTQRLARFLSHPDFVIRQEAWFALDTPKEKAAAVFAKPRRQIGAEKLKPQAAQMITADHDLFWHLQTSKGEVLIQLFPQYAPITCANTVNLSAADYWDQMAIHRVVPNFVVQAGDSRGDGGGDPGHDIPCEVNSKRYFRGRVGMALAGKDTGGGQFFICHSDQPHLDGGYTVFGEVVEGMDIVDRLEQGDLILDTRIERR